MEIIKNKRLDYLDSARGLAAIFVVWGHFIFQYGMQNRIPLIAYSPLRFFYNAIPAVSFFFVLSGMVLSYKYFTKNLEINYKQYAVARLFRLYPAFIVVLILSFLCKQYLYSPAGATLQFATGRDFWAENISLNNFLKEANLFSLVKGSSALVSQRWSLIVEIQISLLIPVMILVTKKSIFWLLGLVFFLMFFFHDSYSSVYLLHFGLGILIALKNKEITAKWKTFSVIKKSSFFITGVLLYNCRYMFPYLQNIIMPGEFYAKIVNNEFVITFIEGIAASLILITLIGSAFLQKILTHKYLTFIGKISYSVYLCHFIILLTLTPICIEMLYRIGIQNKFPLLLTGMVITTALVIVLSAILYYLVEKPFMEYGKIVAAKFSKKGSS